MVSSLLKAGFKSGARGAAKGSKRQLLNILPMKQSGRLYLGDNPIKAGRRNLTGAERNRAKNILHNPEVQAQFGDQSIPLPHELEFKGIETNNPMDAWRAGSKSWIPVTGKKAGIEQQFRNMGNFNPNLQSKGKHNITGKKMPFQTAGRDLRHDNRGNLIGQNREINLDLFTKDGTVRDFKRYSKDNPDFPKTRREIAKILNIDPNLLEQHHLAGAAHWAWLFKGTNTEQASLIHEVLESVGIVIGDIEFNRIDIPDAIHDKLHNVFKEKGLIPPKGDFSDVPFLERLDLLDNMIRDQRFMNEITYDLINQHQRGIPLNKIEYGENPYKPKKAEPNWTGVAKKAIDGQIGKSGWDEARWRSANTQFTWSKADNRGYIDIIKDATGDDAVRTLKAQFFKEIDNLPSGTTWTLEADTAQKYRIYKRMFRDDPRIKPGGDKKLLETRGIDHFVLTIP